MADKIYHFQVSMGYWSVESVEEAEGQEAPEEGDNTEGLAKDMEVGSSQTMAE
jgi:hypothetical protein